MTGRDTIFALASAPGRAGVAVVRISGPDAAAMLRSIFGRTPPPRRAVLGKFRGPGMDVFDRGMALFMPGPASFTGEDVAELHLHGGPAVIDAAVGALEHHGGRPAEPGEFSRRAFEAGKLDLTQAEAIADLVDAETVAQRTQALSQMAGDLSQLYDGWRAQLIGILARLEADIDFPDEGDVPAGVASAVGVDIDALAGALEAHLSDSSRGERVREGFQIAIVGPPNAGKSTLLNALLGRDAAIVTDIPGTTRDVIEGRLVLSGYLVILADTAGLRQTCDVVEAQGVLRAEARAEAADLRILVLGPGDDVAAAGMGEMLRPGDVMLRSKSDLSGHFDPDATNGDVAGFSVSAKTGAGLDALLAYVTKAVTQRLGGAGAPSLTRARHRRAVEAALAALRRAQTHAGGEPELAGEDVRIAARALGEITGRVDVEDVLDRVFADFCIGK